MLINPPSNKGVPINPYPVDIYDHVFECVTINCLFTLTVEIILMRVPNKVSVWDKTDWVWRCPKCDEVQIARADLPESIPQTKYAELRKQGGNNGTGKKRKRSPKKKDMPRFDPDDNVEGIHPDDLLGTVTGEDDELE